MPKCKYCGSNSVIKRGIYNFCSDDHAYQFAISKLNENREKAKLKVKGQAKREHAKRKESLKSRSEWLKDAQAEFNKFIRLRDADLPCISCGRFHQGQYHAGHYLSVGSHPELRFEELNVWRQCMPCNAHLSGNIVNYRKALIDKIGLDKVEWLEGKHEPLKLTIEQIKEIKATYREKCKQLVGVVKHKN